jgi:hypothetical protein
LLNAYITGQQLYAQMKTPWRMKKQPQEQH